MVQTDRPQRRRSDTRARILEVATQLFAEQGYGATSIAQIQTEVGLAPGSGALYKHFGSKESLLDAIVATYIARLDDETTDVLDAVSNDPEAALPMVAQAVRASMSREAPLLRLVLRDLENRPDLVATLWNSVLAGVPGRFATWVNRARDAGTVRADATADDAVILMASLMEDSTVKVLIGRDFSSMLGQPFDDAWVRVALRALTIT